MRYFPLFLLSSALTGCNFEHGVGPFNLMDIERSKEPSNQNEVLFSWDAEVQGVGFSVCLKNKNAYRECESLADVTGVDHASVRLNSYSESNSEFFVIAKDDVSETRSNEMTIPKEVIDSLIKYIKAPNAEKGDYFGHAVALSADGNTLAVSAKREGSNAKGINGDPFNNLSVLSGAVYIYRYNGQEWKEQAYIKASNADTNDRFGMNIALNSNGNTLIVGAFGEASKGAGVNSNAGSDNSAPNAGALYVYTFNKKSGWVETAYIKASNPGANDHFASSVSLNAQGNLILVGAWGEDSNGTGINPAGAPNELATDSGAAYLFRLNAGTWAQEAFVKASNTDAFDKFGHAVILSADSKTFSVGATGEASSAVSIDGMQSDNSAAHSGAVYVYKNENTRWTQKAYIKPSNAQAGDLFGSALSLSASGNRLAVGAIGESSNATGINGDEANNLAPSSGAGYLFDFNGSIWEQKGYLKASYSAENDYFGNAVSLNASGKMLLFGAKGKAFASTANENGQANAGALFVYAFDGIDWAQKSELFAPNAQNGDMFATSLTQSASGNLMAVGATGEASKAVGINGDKLDNSAPDSGAVYVY